MAEESNYSRTEPASEKRLEQARAEGRIPRSAELSSLLVLGTMAGALMIWGAHLFGRLQQLFSEHFRQAAQLPPESAFILMQQAATEILPFLAALFAAALIAPLLLSGWVLAFPVLRFRSERLNPFRPVSRLFSAAGFFDAFKALLKIAALLLLLWVFYRTNLDELAALPALPLQEAVAVAGGKLAETLLLLLAAILLAALFDAPWQWRLHLKGLSMTRAEVLAEAREAEGSPELKARIRARRQAMRLGRVE